MKLKRKIAAALLGVMTVVTAFPAGVANATNVNTYTYNCLLPLRLQLLPGRR